ncbi:hypothetical protein LJR232_003109 [Aquipseudomonas alcaligenes]
MPKRIYNMLHGFQGLAGARQTFVTKYHCTTLPLPLAKRQRFASEIKNNCRTYEAKTLIDAEEVNEVENIRTQGVKQGLQ